MQKGVIDLMKNLFDSLNSLKLQTKLKVWEMKNLVFFLSQTSLILHCLKGKNKKILLFLFLVNISSKSDFIFA